MNNIGGEEGISLWDEEDNFYYDFLHFHNTKNSFSNMALKVRSIVGLIPLFAVTTIEDDLLNELPNFKKRIKWFIDNRPDLTCNISCLNSFGDCKRHLLSLAVKVYFSFFFFNYLFIFLFFFIF